MSSVVETYRTPCFIPPCVESVLNPDAYAVSQRLRTMRIYEVQNNKRSAVSLSADRQPEFRVFNAKHRESLPGKELNDVAALLDPEAKRALEGAKKVCEFYKEVFERNSIDGNGMDVDSTVHYGVRYPNAFWNGRQMVYGDGNQDLVTFTRDGDVIAHEITHGVTEKTIDLQYHVQPGALNESLSDIFGSMFKQYELKELAMEADWLIGDFMIPDKPGKKKKQPIKQALRSMKDEVAYDNKRMGKDTQPKYMKDYKDLPDDENNDYGGVHDNSGIPNHWFYRAATDLGGYSWKKMGQIVYRVMDKKKVTPEATFTEFAAATIASAKKLYGEGAEVMAVTNAWRDVGVMR